MGSVHSNVGLSKKVIIAQVIKNMPTEISFTEKKIDQLYNFSVECRNNSLTKDQLISKISNLRGGSFIDVAACLEIISAILVYSSSAFQTQFKSDYSTSFAMVIWQPAFWK